MNYLSKEKTKKLTTMKMNSQFLNQQTGFMPVLKNTARNFMLVGCILFGNYTAEAQTPAPLAAAPTEAEMPAFRHLSLGLKVTHLYDLKYTAYDLLPGGFSADDAYGLNGPKTKFDMAAGLEVNYYFGPLFSLDLSYEKGKMTGANTTHYYESAVSFVSLGANIDFKRASRTKEYKLIPYGRASLSRGTYDCDLKYKENNSLDQSTNGSSMMFGVGLGLKYYFNEKWSVNIMSEYVTINTDAWDGYDYGTGNDQIIKSSIGLRYAFGKGKHIDRTLAWQDNRVDKMETKINEQVNNAIKSINDSVETKFQKMMNQPGIKDSDDDGIVDKYDKCPDVAGLFSNNGCPSVEEEVVAKERDSVVAAHVNGNTLVIQGEEPKEEPSTPKAKNNSGSTAPSRSSGASKGLSDDEKYRLKNEILVEMNPIRFAYNSYQLNAKAYENLNTIAVILRNNSNYKISLKGYTDDDGSASYNKKLAEQRAKAVSEYLQSRGVSKERISILAMGKDSPLDDNNSKIGKSNNRRVECRLE